MYTALNVQPMPRRTATYTLRGGGGTTWGIITAMTVRAHPIPKGGFTMVYVEGGGDLCEGFDMVCASPLNHAQAAVGRPGL